MHEEDSVDDMMEFQRMKEGAVVFRHGLAQLAPRARPGRHVVGEQGLGAAQTVDPPQAVVPAFHEVDRAGVVVAHEEDPFEAVIVSGCPGEEVDHPGRVGTAVHVVAEVDDATLPLCPRRGVLEDHPVKAKKKVRASVNIAHGVDERVGIDMCGRRPGHLFVPPDSSRCPCSTSQDITIPASSSGWCSAAFSTISGSSGAS